MEQWGITVAGLIISVSTLLYAVFSGRAKASADYVRVLEARVTHAEKALEACEARSGRLEESAIRYRDENMDLLRRLMHVESVTGARELK